MKLKAGLLAVFFLISLPACRQIFAPDYPEKDQKWEKRKTSYFVMYYRADSLAEQNIDHIIQQENNARSRILDRFGLFYKGIISVFIYRSAEDAGWDNVGGRAYPRTETIEAVYGPQGKTIGEPGVSAHEMAHVITHNRIGTPGTSFMSEGAAVAMDDVWFGDGKIQQHVHAWTNQFFRDGKLPALETLIHDFHTISSQVSYPVSGSFSLYILDLYGEEAYKQLFFEGFARNFKNKFKEIYGLTLDEAQEEWIAFCNRY